MKYPVRISKPSKKPYFSLGPTSFAIDCLNNAILHLVSRLKLLLIFCMVFSFSFYKAEKLDLIKTFYCPQTHCKIISVFKITQHYHIINNDKKHTKTSKKVQSMFKSFKNLTSMTRFFGGRPRFLLNMSSMFVVKVIVTGSLFAAEKFHFLVYSCNL